MADAHFQELRITRKKLTQKFQMVQKLKKRKLYHVYDTRLNNGEFLNYRMVFLASVFQRVRNSSARRQDLFKVYKFLPHTNYAVLFLSSRQCGKGGFVPFWKSHTFPKKTHSIIKIYLSLHNLDPRARRTVTQSLLSVIN